MNYFNQITFDKPWVLIFLALIPFVLYYYIKQQINKSNQLKLPSTKRLTTPKTFKTRLRNLPAVLRTLSIAGIIVALAQPAKYETLQINEGEGIDIVLCLDVSGSMLAQDFKPNRLLASINVAKEFIKERKGDRLGLVIFSGQSLTLCPLTTDLAIIDQQLDRIEYGNLSDGTAIGSGLASSVDRLRASTSKSKIVILLTDGENTGGLIDPETAKQLAINFGIRVYTIGIGSTGMAPMPVRTVNGEIETIMTKVSIDENLLKDIASSTKGKYYRAADENTLNQVYTEINTLEKSKVTTKYFEKRTDQYFIWVLAALVLLCLEVILKNTLFKRFP